jgi:hypothetical protein
MYSSIHVHVDFVPLRAGPMKSFPRGHSVSPSTKLLCRKAELEAAHKVVAAQPDDNPARNAVRLILQEIPAGAAACDARMGGILVMSSDNDNQPQHQRRQAACVRALGWNGFGELL